MKPLKQKLAPDFSDGVDRKLLKRIRDRFLSVNQQRLDLAKQGMSVRHQDVLHVLPLFYQVNHPLLPGYVGQEVPSGLSGYEPDKTALRIAKSFSQTFKFRQDKRSRAAVHSLFMMGSTGTLAHSEGSDVDLWLCIDPGLDENERQLLEQKAQKIDAWADELGMELHTFLMDAKAFKEGGAVPSMDSESSGSAQHYLLLDEFYRTAILIAGRYPLWWLIPPDLESKYDHYTDMLLSKRFIKEVEVLDFGSASDIPKSELIGAGLWQLYKGLDAPYKSVLKLMLAEVYAQELPKSESLSQIFKRAVYDDELDVEALDPYVLIYKRLEAYLLARNELKRLDLVRKSFYLKVAKKLSSRPTGRKASWQRVVLQKIVNDWAWSDDRIKFLDMRQSWKLDQVVTERQEVMTELSQSYRFLASFARANNIVSSITDQDLNILGRKLYAVFQRKAGKVERVNPGIATSLWEENLAIHHGTSQPFLNDQTIWLLYRDLASAADASFHPVLKKSRQMIELLAWLYFNGVLSKQTRLSMVPGNSEFVISDVQSVISALEQSIPLPLPKLPQHNFSESPYVSQIILFINLGIDPFSDSAEKGIHRLTDQTDSLSYSTERKNLVKTIDQVVLNSWNEVSTHRYEMGETLMQNLQAYLQQCHDQKDKEACKVEVFCFGRQRGQAIAERVASLFKDVRTVFFNKDAASGEVVSVSSRFVIEIEKHYYILMRVDDQFRALRVESEVDLFEVLSQSVRAYSPIVIDKHALFDKPLLRKVLSYSKKGIIQVFYYKDGGLFHLYVFDEMGSVLSYAVLAEDEVLFQASIARFLAGMIERRQLNESLYGDAPPLNYALFKAQQNRLGDYSVALVKEIVSVEMIEMHLNILAEDDHSFDLAVKDQNFCQQEYEGRQLEAAFHYYQNVDQGGADKPLKILDVQFSPSTHLGAMSNERYDTLRAFKIFFEQNSKLSQLDT